MAVLDTTGLTRLWQKVKAFFVEDSENATTGFTDNDVLFFGDDSDTETLLEGYSYPKIKHTTFGYFRAFLKTNFDDSYAPLDGLLKNQSVASQTGFSSLTYLNGSVIAFPYAPKVGTTYRLIFDVTKTAAGTGTPRILIKIGTTGSNSDPSKGTIVFGAGTAVVDSGIFEVIVTFRSVGVSTAVVQSIARLTSNLTTTGLSNAKKAVFVTSGTFDSTVNGLYIGAAYDGGTSASHTIQLVRAELIM